MSHVSVPPIPQQLIGPLQAATVYDQVPADWMPASAVKPFIEDDPATIWLEHWGYLYGFEPDQSEYDLIDFIFGKSREFEKAWCEHICPTLTRVCSVAYEVRQAAKVRDTFALMCDGVPVIGQAALWWAPERIYGTADLLVHSVWLNEHFPGLLSSAEAAIPAPNLGKGGLNGHYLVADLKFKTKLDEPKNRKDLQIYAAQVRLYSYMLGHLQGIMPRKAFVITRDQVSQPYSVCVASQLGEALDTDLALLRDQFRDIKSNGAKYLPWQHDVVRYSMDADERWATAKKRMANEYFGGRDPRLIYQVGTPLSKHLASKGFPSLDSLLASEPSLLPIDTCKGYGGTGIKAKQIRAILHANREGKAIPPVPCAIPARKPFEFFVDFEYFTNIDVDCDTQWPLLSGCEMVFMIGVGWDENGWQFTTFVANAECQESEKQIFTEFLNLLDHKTAGKYMECSSTAIYHWTPPEHWQSLKAADRHFPDPNHPLRALPLVDLQKNFLETPCAIPGALSYDLKETAKNIGKLVP